MARAGKAVEPHCLCPPPPGMSERERQVMKKLKEVVDKQRDEIRAKDRELGLKNEDVEAVSDRPCPRSTLRQAATNKGLDPCSWGHCSGLHRAGPAHGLVGPAMPGFVGRVGGNGNAQ